MKKPSKTTSAMKGKGKGKAVSPPKGKHRDIDKEVTDLKDCPLQFPNMSSLDHSRQCPRYTAVLARTEEEGIGLEDLDTVQLELELLLLSVNKRNRLLEGEIEILNNWQEKKEFKKPNVGKTQPVSPGKRGKPENEKSSKKYKDGKGEPKPIQHTTPGRPPKSKIVQNKVQQEPDVVDSPAEASRLPKNDAPNRFWGFVEPYCADITNEDLKLLETLIKQHEEDSEFYKVTPLGKHYSIKWAQEDMIDEQQEGAKTDKRRGLTNNTNHNSNDAEKLLKKGEKEKNDDTTPLGSLTQRLVSCLIEENLMSSLEDAMADTDSSDGTMSVSMNRSGFIRSLSISNSSNLEKRIKKELEEQGILDLEDMLADSPDDEILAELRKCQLELRAVSSHNIQALKKLLRLSKEEISKQELRKKMQVADAEVMEAYRRITSCRQKKKTPTKKEKDQAWKALKERESIIKTLDGL